MILQTIISEYKSLLKELTNAMATSKTTPTFFNTSKQNTKETRSTEDNNMKYSNPKICNTAFLLSMAGLMALFITACSSSASQPPAPPPPNVTVSAPLEQNIMQYDEFTGRFRAIERVEVRARVDGYLEDIKFTDGQLIEKGDVLFVIDQRPYKIALEHATAELENAKTRLELTEKELQRAQNLKSTGAVSQELIDRRNQEYQSAKAAVTSAQAAINSAELNMEFTEVKAPVSGKISENFVSVGNLVSGGLSSATLLTRIVSFDPIYFTFEASEDQLLKYLKDHSFAGEVSGIQDGKRTVLTKLLGENKFTHKGELDFVDNEIDESTGTMLVRAIFSNENLLLTPGMFARAKFSAGGRQRELLIPDETIASDQSRKYVLVVDDSSKVGRKFIETGSLHNNLRVIEGGLAPGDQIIINGFAKVRPGQKVSADKGEIALAGRSN